MGSLDTWSTYHRTNILVACTLLYQFSIFLGVINVFPMFSHMFLYFPRLSPMFSYVFPMFSLTSPCSWRHVFSQPWRCCHFFLMPHGWAGVGWGGALTFLFTCRTDTPHYDTFSCTWTHTHTLDATLWFLLLHLQTRLMPRYNDIFPWTMDFEAQVGQSDNWATTCRN